MPARRRGQGWACMFVCVNACMFACVNACMFACVNVCMYVWTCACVYVSKYAFSVCMQVCIVSICGREYGYMHIYGEHGESSQTGHDPCSRGCRYTPRCTHTIIRLCICIRTSIEMHTLIHIYAYENMLLQRPTNVHSHTHRYTHAGKPTDDDRGGEGGRHHDGDKVQRLQEELPYAVPVLVEVNARQ